MKTIKSSFLLLVAILFSFEGQAKLKHTKFFSNTDASREIPSMAIPVPHSSLPEKILLAGSKMNGEGREQAFLKIEHFPQDPSTHLGETVDLNKNLQFSEITHVCWDETGEFLFAAGNFVGSIDFGGSGIMHMDPTISQESESRTFLARFRLENDFLFPMQLLDLGPGEPVSMVVGEKDLMKSIYLLTNTGRVNKVNFFGGTFGDPESQIVETISHGLKKVYDVAAGDAVTFLGGENSNGESVIVRINVMGDVEVVSTLPKDKELSGITLDDRGNLFIAGTKKNQLFVGAMNMHGSTFRWSKELDANDLIGLTIKNDRLLVAGKTVGEEIEDHGVKMFALNQGTGKLLDTSAFKKDIHFANGMCKESSFLTGIRVGENNRLSNVIVKLDWEEDGETNKPGPTVIPPIVVPDLPYVDFKSELKKVEQRIAELEVKIIESDEAIASLSTEKEDLEYQVKELTAKESQEEEKLYACREENQNLLTQIDLETEALRKSLALENDLLIQVRESEAAYANLKDEIQNISYQNHQLLAQVEQMDAKASVPHIKGWHYTEDRGWLWTDHENYPLIYQDRTKSWAFYDRGTSSPWWYYDLGSSEWTEWE
jgi:hypothetical protein